MVLRSITKELAQAGAFDAALTVARGIRGEMFRTSALKSIGEGLARAGAFDDALAVANEIGGRGRPLLYDRQQELLRDIAIMRAQGGDYDAALAIVSEIKWQEERVKALRDIALAQGQHGNTEVARTTLAVAHEAAQPDTWGGFAFPPRKQWRLRASVAVAQAQIGDREGAQKTFAALIAAAEEAANSITIEPLEQYETRRREEKKRNS